MFSLQSPQKLVSFDADFQLVRKASSGGTWVEPKHTGRFFESQADVDRFLGTYSDASKKQDVVWQCTTLYTFCFNESQAFI
jgi:hypothetical protein